MKLTEIAAAIKAEGRPDTAQTFCIYGKPRSGKTRLAATAAKIPWVENVYLIDIENGHETVLTMYREGILTDKEAEKITVYRIPDLGNVPRAMETVLKMYTVNKDLPICNEHGKIFCVTCTGNDKGPFVGTNFNLGSCTKNDFVILDNATALSISILNYYMMGKNRDVKAGWDEYGPQGLNLTDLLLVVQRARTNHIWIAHQYVHETEIPNTKPVEKKYDYYPSIGTHAFSKEKGGGYFQHIIYTDINNLGKHIAGSSSTWRPGYVTGSRSGWMIEKLKEPDLSELYKQHYPKSQPTP